MKFSRKVLIGLAAGIATGLFFGELVAPLTVMADGFIRLLQMTVLPYVTLSIVANIGKLTYVQTWLAGNDQAWVRYVNTWIQLKKRDGFIDALYQQWILGRAATRDKTRWSILRDVVGW